MAVAMTLVNVAGNHVVETSAVDYTSAMPT